MSDCHSHCDAQAGPGGHHRDSCQCDGHHGMSRRDGRPGHTPGYDGHWHSWRRRGRPLRVTAGAAAGHGDSESESAPRRRRPGQWHSVTEAGSRGGLSLPGSLEHNIILLSACGTST
eukprot:2379138-Rhodomonas_salina.1